MLHRRLRALKLVAIILLGVGTRAAWAEDELYVTNAGNDSITVYTRTASGNVAPLRTISGAATGLDNPIGIAVDTVNNEIVVANINLNSVTVHARNANGNVAPLRTISGAATLLQNPRGLALDVVNNEIIVASASNNRVHVYARTANGNASPLRTIMGAELTSPGGLALDLVNNEIAVVNRNLSSFLFSVTVYARTANGNVAPLRSIMGANTELNAPFGVAVDAVNNEILVTNGVFPSAETVTVFARTANGDVPPLRTISGGSTGLSAPEGVAVDNVNNEIVVANVGNVSVRAYARTANGNATPVRTLQGGFTALSPTFLAVTPGAVLGAKFHTVPPCRVADTRDAASPYGGPALFANAARTFVIIGKCLIPLTATTVAFNFTITQPTGQGDVRIFPDGGALPLVSSLNWSPGQTRANNAVISLGASGGITAHVDQAAGTTDFIIDVTGYFQ